MYKEVGMGIRQYEIVLNTWSEWLEMNINRSKTKIFFMSPSPFHFGYIFCTFELIFLFFYITSCLYNSLLI